MGSVSLLTRTGVFSVRVESFVPKSTRSETSTGAHCSVSLDVALRRRLVTSIHSPSLTPVWTSVRSARPLSYRQMKDLPPA